MGLRAGWLAFFLFVWIIGAMLGSSFEYQNASTWSGNGTGGYATSPVTTINYLLNIKNVTQKTEVLGVIPVILPNQDYFKTAFRIVLWQFSFFYDTAGNFAYGMVYYIFFLPFTAMGILSLIVLVYSILAGNLSRI